VCNPPSEALYLRDEETAAIWTPTPAPAGSNVAYQIRHGAGFTTWLNRSQALEQEWTIFVAPDDPVKFARLRLHNPYARTRRITATYYAEWQLGAMRSTHSPHIVCEYDAEEHALLARNSWNPEFGERVAFLAASRAPHSLTTDRCDFLGREGDTGQPAGLTRWDLGGRVDATVDPCAAFQAHLDIAAGETTEIVFILGQGRDRDDAKKLIRKWREPEKAQHALDSVRERWDRLLTTVRVKTPDPAFDLMLNHWLVYQTLSSRIMARAGFYQAGGAIGFRDQLQDVLALLLIDPARARAHILDCAARQFEEGDVLHWWHPPLGRGVRTRYSDDLLWLPYVTSRYVEATGDTSILNEQASFLKAPPLAPEEKDRYALFETSDEKAPLFEHCRRALARGATTGPQGLPLIGGGDWNDGMNRVGAHGRGESVWLAWFVIATMTGCADLAIRMNREDLADEWRVRAANLQTIIDETSWDGEWYVRAFDDDGQPWGSKSCEDCRIDSIAQSWAVLSGAQTSERARTAVGSAVRELVREDERLVRLLWPPIHDTPRDPGYIKAYPPGVRENGGQYSHAAAWLGLALAELGDGDGAWRIFDIINPIRRTASREAAARYRDEPYVVAADVSSAPPHVGRGGWSWYTGAAAWTWRLGLEGILGVKLSNGALKIDPCLPKSWGAAQVEIRTSSGSLSIEIEDPERLGKGVIELTVDGEPFKGATVAFPTDGSVGRVRAIIKHAHQAQPGQTEAASAT
jgi:cyclic beta-1,2-glucan synthetase